MSLSLKAVPLDLYLGPHGDPLTEAQIEVGEHWRYVRLEVLDAGGRFARANPMTV